MNPGLLNKKLYFEDFKLNSHRIIKTKRRDDEQNEETYNFVIRKTSRVVEYQTFTCEKINYIILTAEEYQKEKGYLLLRCEKAKIHSFYDTCSVKRKISIKKQNGGTVMEDSIVYHNIPCEIIKLKNSSASESDQQNQVIQVFELHMENHYSIKIGDKLEIVHKSDTYKAIVQSFFKNHIHQVIDIKVEEVN